MSGESAGRAGPAGPAGEPQVGETNGQHDDGQHDDGQHDDGQQNDGQQKGDLVEAGKVNGSDEGGINAGHDINTAEADEVAGSVGDERHAALEQARVEAAENKDKYLRSAAEFENYKKRSLKERSELIRYQGESIVVELLEVLDGFERAMAHADADPAAVIGGLKMIHKQFVDALGRFEIRAESSIGKPFDPNRQRAIGKEKRDGVAANEVIGELKKGYLYRDKLIRLGEVVVAAAEEK